MPLPSSCLRLLGTGVSIKEELFVRILPALKYHLIYQEKHRNETLYLWGFFLSRNAMQLSKSFFQEAKKVSKGVDHQHTLGLRVLTPSLVMHPFFRREKWIYFKVRQ